MNEVTNFTTSKIGETYGNVISMLPPFLGNFMNFFLIVFFILVYSIFIWKFHEFISKKNFLGLNLNKYNRAVHPVLDKFLASVLFLIEYLLILPILVFFWFAVLALFLILLTDGISVSTILLISATIVATIRMIAYYRADLAREIAKLFPLTLLAVAITTPGFFDLQRIFLNFSAIPSFFQNIVWYLLFIIIIEFILRGLDLLFTLIGAEDGEEK